MRRRRPASMVWFDWLFGASLVSSYAGSIYLGEVMIEFIWIDIIVFALMMLLWYFISYEVNNIAKWIYLALCAVSLGAYALLLVSGVLELEFLADDIADMSLAENLFGTTTQLLSMGTVICLFLKSSQIWFRSKGQFVDDDELLRDRFK